MDKVTSMLETALRRAGADNPVTDAVQAMAIHDKIVETIRRRKATYDKAKERYERAVASAERITPEYSSVLGVRVQTSRGSGDAGLFRVVERREAMDDASGALADAIKVLDHYVQQAKISRPEYNAYRMHNVHGKSFHWISMAYYNDFAGDRYKARYAIDKAQVAVCVAIWREQTGNERVA